jgi:hypothetical protein
MKKKVLVISPTAFEMNLTMGRYAEVLKDKDKYDLTFFCTDAVEAAKQFNIQKIDVEFYTRPSFINKVIISLLSLLRLYPLIFKLSGFRMIKSAIAKQQYDLIICQGVIFLPAIFGVKSAGTKVILDAQEYYPREFEESFIWRLIKQPVVYYLCRTYLRRVDLFFTLGEIIAQEFTKQFGVECKVIYNDLPFNNTRLSFDAGKKEIRIIHHGAAMPSRQIELMIKVAELLEPRFTLDLLLVKSSPAYYSYLEGLVEKQDRVRLIEPIPTSQLIDFAAQYDIGLFLVQPSNFSYLNCCPTKFWQFIQSGLCLATGPFPELVKFIDTHKLGVYGSDFTPAKLADKINALSALDVYEYRKNSVQASAVLNAERTNERLLQMIEALAI